MEAILAIVITAILFCFFIRKRKSEINEQTTEDVINSAYAEAYKLVIKQKKDINEVDHILESKGLVIESSIVNGVFDTDNIVTREQFEKSYKAQYPKATDEAVNRIYGYLTQESEFSSNLHPLIESNMIKGKSGVPNFKNISELDDAVNNTYVSVPYNDPMFNIKIIYNHLIKDKDRFRQVFNKYAHSIPRPIDISILYPKQTTK